MFKNWFKPKEKSADQFADRLSEVVEKVVVRYETLVQEKMSELINSQFKDIDSVAYMQKQKLQLEKDVENLKKQISEIKHDRLEEESKKKIAELELQHLIKMKEEKMDVEFQKKEMTIRQETNEIIHKNREEYSQKFIDQLQAQANKINEIYVQIMDRLPNVNVALKQSK